MNIYPMRKSVKGIFLFFWIFLIFFLWRRFCLRIKARQALEAALRVPGTEI